MVDYTGKTIFVGIDVHKNSYSVSVICDGDLVKQDTMIAEPKTLIKYCKKFKGARIKSAYEAGFSGFHLHRSLIACGIENIVVNPGSIAISSRDCVKNDSRDSLKVAIQLSDGRLSSVYIPSEKQEDKRILTRLREQSVKQRNRIACQTKSLLHLHGLILPKTNPRVNDKWLESIIDQNMQPNLKFALERLSNVWRFYNGQIFYINQEIAKNSQEDEWLLKIYLSSPGIGPTTARKLLYELYDMSQFSNENKLYNYIGLTPREYSSGEHIRHGHITRHGKPIIRKLLVESAWVAIRIDSSLAAIFDKLARRTGKKRAIIAIARILIGRIRTCIKQKRLYIIPDKNGVKQIT
jgi:transposase